MSSKLIATCGCKDSDSPGSSWVQQRQWSRGDWHTFCQCASCHCASCGGWDSPAPEPCGDRTLRTSPHHTRWRRAPLHRRTAGPYPHCAAGQSCGYTLSRYRVTGAVWGRTGPAECGLSPGLSSARVPGFGLFWVNYTNTNGDTVIARYTVSRANPQQADPASALTLFVIAQPFSNHNGGLNTFGPVEGPAGQRYLYIGMGDGGSGGDPQNNAQRDDTLLGKMLRLDPSLEARPALPFLHYPA